MFTGIIRERGTIAGVEGAGGGVRLVVEAPETAASSTVGDSVSVNGVCLTAVDVADGRVAFDAVPETLGRTTLGAATAGTEVNVEPALRAGEPLGGHYVQGHVDGVGSVRTIAREGEGLRVTIEAPRDLLRYCVVKGSVAVDGVRSGTGRRYDHPREDCDANAVRDDRRGDRGHPRRAVRRRRRRPGSRERGRPRDRGAVRDARGDQLHGDARPRPDLPLPDRGARRRARPPPDDRAKRGAAPDRVHGVD